MSFKRARNEEQKKVRIQQILSATSTLLEEYSYKEISLEMIASRLDFSRANMSRYIATKEEIFLALFVDDLGLLCDDIITRKEKVGECPIPLFSSLIAEACGEHKNFLKIGAILNTIIEQNVDAQTLANYKKIIFHRTVGLCHLLQESFSFLKGEHSFRMISMLYHYISGLYPATVLTDIQKEAIKQSGIPYCPAGFTQSLAEFITILLVGYREEYKTNKEPAE